VAMVGAANVLETLRARVARMRAVVFESMVVKMRVISKELRVKKDSLATSAEDELE
jgi:hypothetical protein